MYIVVIFISGLLKTHNLSFQDSESLQAVFDKDGCANVFMSQPRSVKHSFLYNIHDRLLVFLHLQLDFLLLYDWYFKTFSSLSVVPQFQAAGGHSRALPSFAGRSDCVSE